MVLFASIAAMAADARPAKTYYSPPLSPAGLTLSTGIGSTNFLIYVK
jgi:hypothetical protein